MKTYTIEERYKALRKFALIANIDPHRADAIFEKMKNDPYEAIGEAAFDQVMDELCELMQTEN